MILDQVKYTHKCLLPAFIITEHWLKQPKMLPSHVAVECKKLRYINHHKTPANKSSLTGVKMSLDQIKYDYPSFYYY